MRDYTFREGDHDRHGSQRTGIFRTLHVLSTDPEIWRTAVDDRGAYDRRMGPRTSSFCISSPRLCAGFSRPGLDLPPGETTADRARNTGLLISMLTQA